MWQVVTTMLAVGLVTAVVSVPVQAQYAVCIPARGCAPATQTSYNACYQLALRRGWRDSDNDEKQVADAPSILSSISVCSAEYPDKSTGLAPGIVAWLRERARAEVVMSSGLVRLKSVAGAGTS